MLTNIKLKELYEIDDHLWLEETALPTSWGKMFVNVTFWAQALRPYRTTNVGAQCLRPPLDNFFDHHKYGRANYCRTICSDDLAALMGFLD